MTFTIYSQSFENTGEQCSSNYSYTLEDVDLNLVRYIDPLEIK